MVIAGEVEVKRPRRCEGTTGGMPVAGCPWDVRGGAGGGGSRYGLVASRSAAGQEEGDSVQLREFTDDQRKAMLRAIHEREGGWDEVDPDTEVARIGEGIGLSEDQSYEVFRASRGRRLGRSGSCFSGRGRDAG